MKQARKEDRRVARTKQAISHALVALISKRGFEDLTVQDILEEANVGRSTFYAHFQDKEDVLLQGLEELQRALSLRQQQAHHLRQETAFRYVEQIGQGERQGDFGDNAGHGPQQEQQGAESIAGW